MKKLILGIFFFGFWMEWVFPQEIPKTSYFGLGLGIQSTTFKDQLVTQSTYQGSNLYLSLQHLKEKKNTLRFFQWDGSLGKVKTKLYDRTIDGGKYIGPAVNSYWSEISYRHLFLVGNGAKGKWFLGPAIFHLLHLRLGTRWDNSQINYEIAAGLKAELAHRRQIHWPKKNSLLHLGIQVPVAGYILRPSYTGVPDFLDLNKSFITDMFENRYFAWMGNFPRVQTSIRLDMPIASGNRMHLGYDWQVYSFQDPWLTQTGVHTFSFTFLLKAK